MKKTNAIRLLEQGKINFATKEFKVQEDNWHGEQVAEHFEMDASTVYKTLVTRGDKNGVNIFCIAINCELDLKKAAKESGNKSIEMLPMKEVLGTTGYMIGGCSPIGMKKNFPTYIDETAQLFPKIGVSAGARGFEIVLNPEDLCDFVDGKFCDLT